MCLCINYFEAEKACSANKVCWRDAALQEMCTEPKFIYKVLTSTCQIQLYFQMNFCPGLFMAYLVHEINLWTCPILSICGPQIKRSSSG